MIAHLERNPFMGVRSAKAPTSRYFPLGRPAPGNPDTLVYTYDEAVGTIVGEGTYPFLPPLYK